MAIKNDYLLDQIARFVESITAGIGKSRAGRADDAIEAFEAVAGDVLDMDAETALSLAPASLVTMMQLSAVDDSLAAYTVYALERAADAYDGRGDATGQLRRAQAQAIADAFGFEVSVVPPEVQAALDAQEVGESH